MAPIAPQLPCEVRDAPGGGAPGRSRPLSDRQGRLIEYLRLSVTDRCGFRCSYCSPAPHVDAHDFLAAREIARLVGVLARLGIRRVRLTGGEPTLRHDLLDVARIVRSAPGVEEVALTTNGQRLAELALSLRAAGVTAVNVSLDTLDPERLARISGRGADLGRILAGIDEAGRAGFRALKTNTVVMGGVNEDELAHIVRHAWSRGATPRFIELMPFGDGVAVPTARVKALLEEQGISHEPDATRGWGPAHHVVARDAHTGATGLVGFIGALTGNFCDRCNRCRITARGELQACLGGRDRVPLAAMLRAGATDADLEAAVRDALARKDDRHHMDAAGARLVLLPMMGIGG